jgi:hypothetical protein
MTLTIDNPLFGDALSLAFNDFTSPRIYAATAAWYTDLPFGSLDFIAAFFFGSASTPFA